MPGHTPGAPARSAIIDIGSNSVRLVVYRGRHRVPGVLFNEKVMAGLGRQLATDGRLPPDGVEQALAALARFAALVAAMGVDTVRTVATAAVRDASDGPDFIARVTAETGLAVEVIDGPTEALGSAWGVLAGIPGADGVVGDLGGGSLELVRVADGAVGERISVPLGALRLDAARARGERALERLIADGLGRVGWAGQGRGRPFYAVGGSWRALAQVHMQLTGWPLPVVHQYAMPADAPAMLVRELKATSPKALRAIPSLSASRIPQLPGAAALLAAIVERFGASAVIPSAYGLREGLLFQTLPPAIRAQDPLVAGAAEAAARAGRMANGDALAVGDALLAFTDPLFAAEAPSLRRIRHAACHLADTAWRAHPELRAEDGLDTALHGSWVGIDAQGRAMLGAALWTVNGGGHPHPDTAILDRLAPPALLELARRWGLALRLGQRLGGGTAAPLRQARLAAGPRSLVLSLPRACAALYGESVERRHRALAQALHLEPRLRLAKETGRVPATACPEPAAS